jgi:phosphate transport system substrate-binding protein
MRVLFTVAVGLSLAVGVVLPPATAQAEPVAIVVDPNNPKADISLEELKQLFLGKRGEWPDGARAVPVDLEAGSAAREAFNAAVLKMDQAAVERHWTDQKMRGAGVSPKVASSPASALKLVARVRGGVAYVPVSAVDSSVKVLTVGGQAPSAAGYPINSK